jgi:hypothetical protein
MRKKFHLDQETEKLFMKYMNPKETFSPAEAYSLAEGLMQSYQNYLTDNNLTDASIYEFWNDLFDTYYDYLKELPEQEMPGFLDWWKKNFAPASVPQGIITGISPFFPPLLAGSGGYKLALFLAHRIKRRNEIRQIRAYMEALEKKIRSRAEKGKRITKDVAPSNNEIKRDLEKRPITQSDFNVHELATELLEDRRQAYGT